MLVPGKIRQGEARGDDPRVAALLGQVVARLYGAPLSTAPETARPVTYASVAEGKAKRKWAPEVLNAEYRKGLPTEERPKELQPMVR